MQHYQSFIGGPKDGETSFYGATPPYGDRWLVPRAAPLCDFVRPAERLPEPKFSYHTYQLRRREDRGIRRIWFYEYSGVVES